MTKTILQVRIGINIWRRGFVWGQGCRVLDRLVRIIRYRVSIGELIVVGLILGTPDLIVGVIWSSTHTEHLQHMPRADSVVSFLGSIVSWPVLPFANVCLT
jgi:hypothetical protein